MFMISFQPKIYLKKYLCRNYSAVSSLGFNHGLSFTFNREVQLPTQ